MKISIVPSTQISRIGSINRSETIYAKYRCCLAPDGRSIALRKEKLDPPEEVPHWDPEGVRRRVNGWKRELDNGGTLVFAEEDENLIGFSILGREKSGKTAEMVALFVDRDHRGPKGVGRKLTERLEQAARELGIKFIFVQSVESVTSLRFYQWAGYRITCLMDNSVAWIPGLETCIILVKKLED